MNLPSEGQWLARRLALAGSIVGLGFGSVASGLAQAAAESDFSGGVEAVRKFLSQLSLDAEALGEVDAAVAKLDSDRFAERYLASVYLARLPVLPRKRLEAALEGAPLDKRLRLAQIFKANTPELTDSLILRAMEAVKEGGLSGLLPDVIAALEGRQLDAGWDACVGACETTAVAEDIRLLEGSLVSQTALVRAGSAVALIKLKGAAAVADLSALTEDPDDRIKLIVANYLRRQRSHECLQAYAALLMAEEFDVRWKALDALRQISGKDFEYFASSEKAKREGPARAWMDWVVENGATAKLEFTLDGPEELVLFNGEDLEGWNPIKPLFGNANDAALGWGVEDGMLVCSGGANGHLHTLASYRNFVLKLEYRLPDGGGDSGVGLFLTEPANVVPPCLEVQIVHGHAGDLYPLGGFQAQGPDGKAIVYRAERIAAPHEREEDWNHLELKVRAGTVEVSVNGELVNRASGAPEGEAKFTLLNQSTRVEFRRIVLLPLE